MHSGDDTLRPLRDDLRVPDAEADLYLVGLGIGGFDQRTVEVDRLLRGAAAIYHLTAFHEEIEALTLGKVEDLAPRYFAGKGAAATYDALTSYLTEQAQGVREYGYACFLTYGHPLYLVDTSWSILQIAAGLRIKAIAATSFVDRLLCDLNYRFDYGVQIYEANRFITQSPGIDPSTPLILAGRRGGQR
ncbi:SAM-dependent methyltransferase [Curtobacterium flaccumfaciens]|nr:SAM-dependent methyltransferase [Curtobacterium flaccumfaciens]